MRTGRCVCGQVSFQSEGPWRDIISCHCEECRRTTGHFWAATAVPTDKLEITNDEGLKWFRASDFATRGFCTGCGASVFFRMDDKDYTAIGAGCVDDTSGLKFVEEVFTHEKGDYYPLSAGIPHSEGFSYAWKDEEGRS